MVYDVHDLADDVCRITVFKDASKEAIASAMIASALLSIADQLKYMGVGTTENPGVIEGFSMIMRDEMSELSSAVGSIAIAVAECEIKS